MIPGRTAVALCCGALTLLAGCGSGNGGSKIPADTADRLISNIQAADDYNGRGLCARAHTKVRDARFVLTQVPDSVDTGLTQGIADGLAHMDSLISSECEKQQTTTTDTSTDTTPTETTQTETTQTDTTPTETTQTQTTPTTTTPTTTTPTQTTTTETTPTTTTGTGGTPPPPGNGAGAGDQG